MPEPRIRYSQHNGHFTLVHEKESEDGLIGAEELIGVGWAGNHEGKNNPDMQVVKMLGPLPRGLYEIGEPFTHQHTGPYSMRLTPHPDNEMCDRDGFLIHGPSQNPAKYGQESNGCTILEHEKRVNLWESGARLMEVVE